MHIHWNGWDIKHNDHISTYFIKKAPSVEIGIPNTVVLDITEHSEPVRIISNYWQNSQKRRLDDILSLIVEGTILTSDFNAAVKE
jgi:hypothetical protein